MHIAQRGTSFSFAHDGTTSGHTLDRFQFVTGNTDEYDCTVSQYSMSTSDLNTTGHSNALKLLTGTAELAIVNNEQVHISYKIEAQDLQDLQYGTTSAKTVTLSFWVKSSVTGTYAVAGYKDDSTTRIINRTYTINSADTWEKKTLTYAGDTSGTLVNDNTDSLILHLWLGAGTNYSSGTLSDTWTSSTNANRAVGQVNLADSTSNEWYITGVQLEAGTSASDFEFLPVDVNLLRCQRYFEICSGNRTQGSQTYVSNTVYFNAIRFMVTKRAAPTIANPVSSFTLFYNSSYDTNVTWSLDENITTQFTLTMASARDYGFMGSGSNMFTADSEL
jgi:hypothetical protein